MCWKFHGKMPSHRKQEKRKNQEELANKISSISVNLNPLVKPVPAARKLGSLGGSNSSNGATKKPKKI